MYSRDVAQWMLTVVAEGPVCEALNLGHGQGITIRELAETVISVTDPSLTLEWDTGKPTGDPVRILSMDKTTSLLGDLPRTSLAEVIRQTVEWYRSSRDIPGKRLDNTYAKQRASLPHPLR